MEDYPPMPRPILTRYEIRKAQTMMLSGIPIAFFGMIAGALLLVALLISSPLWLLGLAFPGSIGLWTARKVSVIREQGTRKVMSAFMRRAMGGKK